MPVNACGSTPASFDPHDYDPSNDDPSTSSSSTCTVADTTPDAPTTSDHSPSQAVAFFHELRPASNGDMVAGAAMLKGHDERSGVDVEVFSVGGEVGPAANGVQATMARVGISGHNVAGSVEVFTAHARMGVENPDGSRGFGVSVGTTIVGGEVSGTLGDGAASGSVGVSAGLTFEAAVGVRDADHDGKPELCGRLGFGLVAGDVCIERPF